MRCRTAARLLLTEIRKLFRPFSQANVSIASRFGGAGLGLSSVRQVARAMGGDIAAAQRSGGGTTFTLTVVLGQAAGIGARPPARPAIRTTCAVAACVSSALRIIHSVASCSTPS